MNPMPKRSTRNRRKAEAKPRRSCRRTTGAPHCALPTKTARSLEEFYTAPVHYEVLPRMLAFMPREATTDGINLFVGLAWAKTADQVARALHQRKLCVLDLDHGEPSAKNIELYREPLAEALPKVLDKYPAHFSLLYTRKSIEVILEHAADRIVTGSTVVLGQHVMLDFYNWARQTDREFYVLSRSTRPRAVAVIMAN